MLRCDRDVFKCRPYLIASLADSRFVFTPRQIYTLVYLVCLCTNSIRQELCSGIYRVLPYITFLNFQYTDEYERTLPALGLTEDPGMVLFISRQT
jgi:hypothetical protein